MVLRPDSLRRWQQRWASFNCPNGAGACGTCSTSSNSQGAWAHVINHQDCDNGCTGQCKLKCGDPFLFFKCGSGSGTILHVVDIGPCERSGGNCTCNPAVCGRVCSGDPCGSGGHAPRLMDLTAPTMARFFGGAGCGSCTVGVYCPCTNCTCPYG